MAQPTSKPLGSGSFRLFSVAGINVYLHWSWLVVAFIQIRRNTGYSTPVWAIAEYLALFLIVLLHEFGHAFACRSVGGRADRIVLWPLGGVAFVQPPQRPGAMLWSIVAGPLVNVVLLVAAIPMVYMFRHAVTDVQRLLFSLGAINIGLLIFNLLPIYPLDGGQIVRSLLWFFVGQARSLMIASVFGIVCSSAAIVLLLAFQIFDYWLLIIAAFAIMQSWMGVQQARKLSAVLALPRHLDRHCPSCRQSPPAVPMWGCRCGNGVDVFAADGICPNCGTRFELVPCPFCGVVSPLHAWFGPSPAPSIEPPPIPAVATVSPATRTQV